MENIFYKGSKKGNLSIWKSFLGSNTSILQVELCVLYVREVSYKARGPGYKARIQHREQSVLRSRRVPASLRGSPAACSALECKTSRWEDGCAREREGIRENEKERQNEEQKSFSVTKTSPSVHGREKHPRVCSALKTPLSLESLQHLQKRLPRALSFLLPVKPPRFFLPMWQVQIASLERRSSQLALKWRWTTAPSVDAIAATGGNLRSACGGNASTVSRRRSPYGAVRGDGDETCGVDVGTGAGLTAQSLWKTVTAGQPETRRSIDSNTHTNTRRSGQKVNFRGHVCFTCDEFKLGWSSWNGWVPFYP